MKSLRLGSKLWDLSEVKIMGILNLTPDSFYCPEGSSYENASPENRAMVLQRAQNLIEAGADCIDVGGMSSRPGAGIIDEHLELERILPVINDLREAFPGIILSVDTIRASVAREAIKAGAHMINDISAGRFDDELLDVVAGAGVPYVLMHMQGTPQSMQSNPAYGDVFTEVYDFFSDHLEKLARLGIHDVLLDPGFGFGKSIEHNYELLSRLSDFRSLGKAILAGLSRKSMICKPLGVDPSDALNGTTVLHTLALLQGAQMLRVHDPYEAKQCTQLIDLYRRHSIR